ncbi:unnamed protein product [Cuscuta epithymum]|uniref:Uncharacterized protein n=1 Tax=Cuscuta epithymum TaxID=186058 RepID=A0AAV0EE72_9ASTE|nr:unnamed protein product [Cuscuta epithymum]
MDGICGVKRIRGNLDDFPTLHYSNPNCSKVSARRDFPGKPSLPVEEYDSDYDPSEEETEQFDESNAAKSVALETDLRKDFDEFEPYFWRRNKTDVDVLVNREDEMIEVEYEPAEEFNKIAVKSVSFAANPSPFSVGDDCEEEFNPPEYESDCNDAKRLKISSIRNLLKGVHKSSAYPNNPVNSEDESDYDPSEEEAQEEGEELQEDPQPSMIYGGKVSARRDFPKGCFPMSIRS